MEKQSPIVQFGADFFELRDVWPSNDQSPLREIEEGMLDHGSTYLSFPLTKEQKAFLGNTNASHVRMEFRKKV